MELTFEEGTLVLREWDAADSPPPEFDWDPRREVYRAQALDYRVDRPRVVALQGLCLPEIVMRHGEVGLDQQSSAIVFQRFIQSTGFGFRRAHGEVRPGVLWHGFDGGLPQAEGVLISDVPVRGGKQHDGAQHHGECCADSARQCP